MGIKQIFTAILLAAFLLALLVAGLGGRSESLPFWPGAMLLAGCTVYGALAFARGFHGRAAKPALWAVTGFSAYVILRGVITYYSPEGVAYIARQDLLFAAAAFLCYLAVTAHFEKISHRVWILLVLATLVGVNLYAGYKQGHGFGDYQPQETWAKWFPELGSKLGWEGFMRVPEKNEWAGLFQSENHLGGLLAMLGPLFFGVGLFARGPASWLSLAASAACGWGAMGTTSRGGTVAYLIGIVVVVITWVLWKRFAKGGRTNWVWISSSFAVVVAVGFLIFGMITALMKYYVAHGMLNSDQIMSRFVHARLAWKQFLSAPIFGTGARSYEYMERSFRNLNTNDWNWYTTTDMDAIFAHCDWAQIMGDYGFIGGGLALAVLVTHFAAGLQLLARTAKERDKPGSGLRAGLAAGSLGGILAMAAVSLLDFNLHIAINACVCAILLGFLANPGRVAFEQKVDDEGMPVVPRHGLLLRPAMLCLGVAFSMGILVAGPDLLKADRTFWDASKYASDGNYYEAMARFQETVDSEPQHYMACMEAGNMNYEEARKILNAIPENASQEQKNFQNRIRNSFLLRASEWYDKAYQIYPRYPYAAMGAGHAMSRSGDYDLAESWFQKALVYGQGSRKLAIEYGTHLLLRAIAAPDAPSKLKYLEQALVPLQAASDKFRDNSPERDALWEKIGKGKSWRERLIKEIAEKNPKGTTSETPGEQKEPAPLVPAAPSAPEPSPAPTPSPPEPPAV